jgi:NTE family protein
VSLSQSVGGAAYALQKQRKAVGLSLSGGGFRAALFHLGAMRRLNELNILAKLSSISSVSGGSILSAHLAEKIDWPVAGPVDNWDEDVAEPFRHFCTRNIRTKPILEGLLPWVTNSEILAEQYQKYLTDLKIVRLPDAPDFIFCATDLTFGVNWKFNKAETGDYQAGHPSSTPADWNLSFAVAASSCFPPIFKPLSLGRLAQELQPGKFPPGQTRDEYLQGLRLSDGGVYDNLGLEPIWNTHDVVLCSDGGALFSFGADQGMFWEVKRYVAIPENQSLALRKRWLISKFSAGVLKGTYWGVGSSPSSYGVEGGYSKGLAQEVIAKIRTDLDAFSDAEAAVLENHGYTLADAAITAHVPEMVPNPKPQLIVPHPEWLDETKVRNTLKGSSKRKLLGRW